MTRSIWFAQPRAQQVARITTDGRITEFRVPTGGNPLGITVGPDGNVWYALQAGNMIGQLDLRH